MGWTTKESGLDSQWGQEILLSSIMSRPALGPTHPPIQWVQGAVSLRVKQKGCEADYSPPSSAEVKNNGTIPLLPYMSSGHGD
jgi:hypothetical protein